MSRVFICALALGALLLAGCERPPMKITQQGFRGTAMQQVDNPRLVAERQAALPAVPVLPPPSGPDGPKAGQIYQNVKVLGDLPVAEFTRHMLAITAWVSPNEGCNYCHNPANLADDSKYTKVVARRMIEMTRHLNADWKGHVGDTGVTCHTCHRGHPVPQQVWYRPAPQKANTQPMMGNDFGQNKAASMIGLTSLPRDPFTPYLQGSEDIKVYGKQPLPQGIGKGKTIQHTEQTYALMIHFSKSLGVNCTFCHNSQAFSQWVSPKKVTAWHGIRMERDINNAYLTPLTASFPANRLGPTGDVAKAYCATCHQGASKPLDGLPMAKDFVGLQGAAPAAVAALPAPLNEAQRTVLYFGVGSAELAGTQAQGLTQLLVTLAAEPGKTAFVSGYHSAAGDLAQNQELAKNRAIATRDALVAGGIPAARVKLDKPQQTEANIAGEDPTSRRVEVRVQ